jgi:hypothetical protein
MIPHVEESNPLAVSGLASAARWACCATSMEPSLTIGQSGPYDSRNCGSTEGNVGCHSQLPGRTEDTLSSNEKRSPLKEKPLRYPGQSLDEQLDHMQSDMLMLLLAALLGVAVAVWEWWRWYWDYPPQPIVATVFAVVVAGYCIPKLFRLSSRRRDFELGRDGERLVGQALEELRQEGYSIFHDVVGKDFNVDHVVVSQRGIFAIETKTYRKREGNPKITFDGEKILVDGKSMNPSPVEQATRNANWLEQTLLASTGKGFAVRPVIVFPGWCVEPSPKGTAAWVLNPKVLPDFIRYEPATISDADLHLIAFHLSRYIRAN